VFAAARRTAATPQKCTNVKIEPCPISIIIGTVGNSASIMLAGIPFK
jgi:hypothetical protein